MGVELASLPESSASGARRVETGFAQLSALLVIVASLMLAAVFRADFDDELVKVGCTAVAGASIFLPAFGYVAVRVQHSSFVTTYAVVTALGAMPAEGLAIAGHFLDYVPSVLLLVGNGALLLLQLLQLRWGYFLQRAYRTAEVFHAYARPQGSPPVAHMSAEDIEGALGDLGLRVPPSRILELLSAVVPDPQRLTVTFDEFGSLVASARDKAAVSHAPKRRRSAGEAAEPLIS